MSKEAVRADTRVWIGPYHNYHTVVRPYFDYNPQLEPNGWDVEMSTWRPGWARYFPASQYFQTFNFAYLLTRASGSTVTNVLNGDLTFFAAQPGDASVYKIVYVAPTTANQALTAAWTVDGEGANVCTITLASGPASPAIITTANDILHYINSQTATNTLIGASLAPNSTGTGVVSAMEAITLLGGGSDSDIMYNHTFKSMHLYVTPDSLLGYGVQPQWFNIFQSYCLADHAGNNVLAIIADTAGNAARYQIAFATATSTNTTASAAYNASTHTLTITINTSGATVYSTFNAIHDAITNTTGVNTVFSAVLLNTVLGNTPATMPLVSANFIGGNATLPASSASSHPQWVSVVPQNRQVPFLLATDGNVGTTSTVQAADWFTIGPYKHFTVELQRAIAPPVGTNADTVHWEIILGAPTSATDVNAAISPTDRYQLSLYTRKVPRLHKRDGSYEYYMPEQEERARLYTEPALEVNFDWVESHSAPLDTNDKETWRKVTFDASGCVMPTEGLAGNPPIYDLHITFSVCQTPWIILNQPALDPATVLRWESTGQQCAINLIPDRFVAYGSFTTDWIEVRHPHVDPAMYSYGIGDARTPPCPYAGPVLAAPVLWGEETSGNPIFRVYPTPPSDCLVTCSDITGPLITTALAAGQLNAAIDPFYQTKIQAFLKKFAITLSAPPDGTGVNANIGKLVSTTTPLVQAFQIEYPPLFMPQSEAEDRYPTQWLEITDWYVSGTETASREITSHSVSLELEPYKRVTKIWNGARVSVNLYEWVAMNMSVGTPPPLSDMNADLRGVFAVAYTMGYVYTDGTQDVAPWTAPNAAPWEPGGNATIPRCQGVAHVREEDGAITSARHVTLQVYSRGAHLTGQNLYCTPSLVGMHAAYAIKKLATWVGIPSWQIDIDPTIDPLTTVTGLQTQHDDLSPFAANELPNNSLPDQQLAMKQLLLEDAGEHYDKPSYLPADGTAAASEIKKIADEFNLAVTFPPNGRMLIAPAPMMPLSVDAGPYPAGKAAVAPYAYFWTQRYYNPDGSLNEDRLAATATYIHHWDGTVTPAPTWEQSLTELHHTVDGTGKINLQIMKGARLRRWYDVTDTYSQNAAHTSDPIYDFQADLPGMYNAYDEHYQGVIVSSETVQEEIHNPITLARKALRAWNTAGRNWPSMTIKGPCVWKSQPYDIIRVMDYGQPATLSLTGAAATGTLHLVASERCGLQGNLIAVDVSKNILYPADPTVDMTTVATGFVTPTVVTVDGTGDTQQLLIFAGCQYMGGGVSDPTKWTIVGTIADAAAACHASPAATLLLSSATYTGVGTDVLADAAYQMSGATRLGVGDYLCLVESINTGLSHARYDCTATLRVLGEYSMLVPEV
jgi:hypothetical protein